MTQPSLSQSPTRVMIVEDHGLVLSFLEEWLRSLPGFIPAGVVRTGEEALSVFVQQRPDLLLTDLQLPGMDGLEFVREARKIRPGVRVLILTSQVDPLSMVRVEEAGVEGYLEKDVPPEVLREALYAITGGGTFFSEKFHRLIAMQKAKTSSLGKILSRREQQVLAELLQGLANKEIAQKLTLSPRTVEFHRANLMDKLGAGSLPELLLIVRNQT